MKCKIVLLLILGITFSSSQKGRSTSSHFRKSNHKTKDVCLMSKKKLLKDEEKKIIFKHAKENIDGKKENCEPDIQMMMILTNNSYIAGKNQCNEIEDIYNYMKVLYKCYVII